jgi:hypothetical protein
MHPVVEFLGYAVVGFVGTRLLGSSASVPEDVTRASLFGWLMSTWSLAPPERFVLPSGAGSSGRPRPFLRRQVWRMGLVAAGSVMYLVADFAVATHDLHASLINLGGGLLVAAGVIAIGYLLLGIGKGVSWLFAVPRG